MLGRMVIFAVTEFRALWDNIYECVFSYNRRHGNAVKGLWTLWDNIYDCLFLNILPSFLTVNLLVY
jgi:hypothetical protein